MSYHDKRIINGGEGVNNLAPFKYPWAWEMLEKTRKNDWKPEEIGMGDDRYCYEYRLGDNERLLFTNNFATLTTSDMVVGRNIAVEIMRHITAPEISLFMGRQVWEEGLHSLSYQHILEVLGLDQDEVYYRYQRAPEIRQKFELARFYAEKFDSNTLYSFLEGLIFYYLCFEGIWFYNGFSPIFSLQRRNLMTKTGEQLQYIMRDETNHVAFGVRLIKGVCAEENFKLPQEVVHNIFRQAIEAEAVYAHGALPPVLGYNPEMHIVQAKFLANRRLNQIGYAPLYPEIAEPSLPWLDEQINLKKEKNFFESKVTEYQVGGLVWDD